MHCAWLRRPAEDWVAKRDDIAARVRAVMNGLEKYVIANMRGMCTCHIGV